MTDTGPDNPWRRRARGCGCLLLVFVLLPLLALKACQVSDAHPSDQQMIAEFRQHQADFDRLLAMVRAERHVTRIGDGFIWVDGITSVEEGQERRRYLSDARLAAYRGLFRQLDLESGVVRREDGSVGFLRSSSGMVTAGSSKEFVWSPAPVKGALTPADPRTLEKACVPKGMCRAIRPIAPGWYIAFDSD